MNLKTIIPISLTIIIVASVIGIILNEYPEDEEPCPPLCDYDQDELKHQGDLQEQLQLILDYCENVVIGEDVYVPGSVWNNGTHYINNWDCEWYLINDSEHPFDPDYREIPWNGPHPFVINSETKIKVVDELTAQVKVTHPLNLEFNSLPRPAQSMDGVHNTNFTEACHSSNTIHANFTDGKVITTSDDCN